MMKAWFHRQLAGSQFYTNHKLFTALRGENSTYLSINLHGEHKDERCHLLPKTNGGGEERVKLFTEIQRMDNDEESLVRLLIIVLGYLLWEHHHQNQDWEIAAQWSDFKVICELLRQRFEGFKSLEHSMEETTIRVQQLETAASNIGHANVEPLPSKTVELTSVRPPSMERVPSSSQTGNVIIAAEKPTSPGVIGNLTRPATHWWSWTRTRSNAMSESSPRALTQRLNQSWLEVPVVPSLWNALHLRRRVVSRYVDASTQTTTSDFAGESDRRGGTVAY